MAGVYPPPNYLHVLSAVVLSACAFPRNDAYCTHMESHALPPVQEGRDDADESEYAIQHTPVMPTPLVPLAKKYLPRKAVGTPNKYGRSVKNAFIDAFELMGGVNALVAWGQQEPTHFYRCLVQIAPKTIVGEGDDGAIKILVSVEDVERAVIEEGVYEEDTTDADDVLALPRGTDGEGD